MNNQNYLEEMKTIENNIQSFIEDEFEIEEHLQVLTNLFDEIKLHDDKYKLKSLLRLIVEITNNFHRFPHLFSKIERILQLFKKDIKNFFPNWEIFSIFESNKRILLFLIEEKIMAIDSHIISALNKAKYISDKYHTFLAPEISPYINKKICSQYEQVKNFKENIPEDFKEKRKIGENDNSICKIIREDLIEEFFHYEDKNLNGKIHPSIYETNCFLLNKQPTLIEYAAFFGSIDIFKYLQNNNVRLTPSLWIYAVHSNNIEFIHILENNNIRPNSGSYKNCLEEALKCHHNELAYHIITKHLQNINSECVLTFCLKYYNFGFMQNESINIYSFFSLCKFDYIVFVDILLKNESFDINDEI